VNYVGIDLHRKQMVFSVENEQGPVGKPVRVDCHSVLLIESMFRKLAPFRAVIESSTSYRWLYDLLSPLGECILAHPLKLRAIVSGRAKTDKLDSAMLAKLLRADLIPRSYVPEENYQFLRDVTRARARLVRQATHAKNELHAMMKRCNVRSPYSNALCKRGRQWIAMQDLGYGSDFAKHELLRRIEYYEREVTEMDLQLAGIAHAYPQAEALTDLYGVGLYTALLVVGELGAPERFFSGDKVGAYTGLTAEVRQSGGHEYRATSAGRVRRG